MSDGPTDGPPKGEGNRRKRMVRMIVEDVLGLTAIVVVCLVVYHL